MERNRKIEFLIGGARLGLVKPKIYGEGQELEQNSNSYELEGAAVERPDAPVSYLGNVVVAPLTLKNKLEDLELRLDTVLLQITMQKQIVSTVLQGVNGTIKEYIADGDYEVSVTAMLVNESGAYPTEQMRVLNELLLLPEALVVESELLQLLGIYNLVVQSYSFSDRAGFENIQDFTLECISDKPIELIIEDETLN